MQPLRFLDKRYVVERRSTPEYATSASVRLGVLVKKMREAAASRLEKSSLSGKSLILNDELKIRLLHRFSFDAASR
jgi:hypothetical protein